MAVSNFDVPNLSSNYGQIISQLQNRAQMEGQRPSKLDIGTTIVKRADQEMTKERDLRRAFEIEMKKEGRVLWTPDKSQELAKELEVDPAIFNQFENLYHKPKDMESYAHQKIFVQSLPEEQQEAAAVIPEEAAKTKFAKNKFKKELKVPDPSSSTGYRYHYIYEDGSTEVGSEAPMPSMGMGQGKVVTRDKYGNPVIVDKANETAVPVPSVDQGASKLTQIQKQDIRPIVNDLHEKSSLATQYKSQLTAANLIEKKLDLNNPASIREIQTQLALLAGENGRLTEQDVANQGASRALLDRLGQTYEEIATGKISKKNLHFVKELVALTKKARATALNQQFQGTFNAARDFSSIETYEDFLKLERIVGRDIPDILRSSGQYRFRMITPEGKTGSIDRSGLKKAFEAGWRLADE
jgi:hypothetical protein